MNSRDYRGGGFNHDYEGSRFREEERFRPGQGGSESWRQRGGRTGGSYGDGYRYQGAEAGAFGNPGGGYGEYNWERGGDFAHGGRGREDYNRWGDELGRGREYGGGDYGQYGSEYGGRGEEYGREGFREPSYGYGRGQGSMGSEGYTGYGGGYGATSGPYGTSSYGWGYEGGGAGIQGSTRYGGTSPYGTQGYRTQPYGSQGQLGSQESRRDRGHYGKGPIGYSRSDERLREEVSDRLTADPEVDASRLTVTVKDGEVTLEGTVDERFMKRRAEDIAEDVMGVKQVHNKLRVDHARTEVADSGSLGLGATSVTSTGAPVAQQGTAAAGRK